MKTARHILLTAMIAALPGVRSWAQPTTAPSAKTIVLRRDPRAFPTGTYSVCHVSMSSYEVQRGKEKQPSVTMQTGLAYEMAWPRRDRADGKVVLTVLEVQTAMGRGGKVIGTYRGPGKSEKSSPVLAKLFRPLLGRSSRAKLGPAGPGKFTGLDQAWDEAAQAGPAMAQQAKRCRRLYGDALLDRMMRLGQEFIAPRLVESQATLRLGQTWKVRKTVIGIGKRPEEVEHTCRVDKIGRELVVVHVTYRLKGRRPWFENGGTELSLGDIYYSARFAYHTPSGQVVSMVEDIRRADGVGRETNGKLGPATVSSRKERNILSVRREPDALPG